MTVLVLAGAGVAFLLSAAAGMGGSLLLVPLLSVVLGVKKGVALAAVLLAVNNVAKTGVYFRDVPWRHALGVGLLMALGAGVGAVALVHAPERLATLAVIASLAAALLIEGRDLRVLRRLGGPALALGAGATSGFSGTSGPLKGAALRSLGLDRTRLVAAAAVVSLGTDAAKALAFGYGGLLGAAELRLVVASVPLVLAAAVAGRRINRSLGEQAFARLFWLVMGAYAARLIWV